MSRSPRSMASRIHASALSIVPIASSMSSARLGAPPCNGSGQRADPTDDRSGEVGAGRGDHAGGERRRVEPVVDGGDEVLLDRARVLGRRDLALHHVEVVRGVRERRVGVDDLPAVLQPVQRGEQRRHDRADLQGLLAELRRLDVERRPETERRAHERHRGAEQVERRRVARRARDVGEHGLHRSRDLAQRRDLGPERVGLLPAWERILRTAGTTRLRSSASRRARPRCTRGSGRSLRGRARRRSTSRRRRRLRARGARRARGSRPAGSARCA